MTKKGYTPEQIINKLREAEILLSQGNNLGEASRKIGVTEQTYYRWRKEGLKVPKKQPKGTNFTVTLSNRFSLLPKAKVL